MPKALITGVTGQDGSYLAELLLNKGYKVYGIVRRSSCSNFERINHILNRITLHEADLLDQTSLTSVLSKVYPREVYNLAAQSFVPTSWTQPTYTGDVTGLGVTRILEAIRIVDPGIRFYQASSSEMFGDIAEVPQNENTPFSPRSPYGVAKVFGHFMTKVYRESYGMYTVSGIAFNHESPRRPETFVSSKIVKAAVGISLGLVKQLKLGNIEAKRDWGFAGDYVEAMYLTLQQEKPEDFVIATGETHSVKEFVVEVFDYLGLNWEKYLVIDPALYRPAEVNLLLGDSSKAQKVLGWKPKMSFSSLIHMMVDSCYSKLKST